MKSKITLLTVLLIPVLGISQNWVWAKKAGGNSYDEGNAIAVDQNGNSYITGTFQDTAYFGATMLVSSGDNDVYVAKLDPSGNFLWAKKGGGQFSDGSKAICLDNNGNIYIAGFYNAAAITFGSITLPAATWDDIFLVKYDNSGNVLWAVKAGGSQNDYAYGLVADGAGNVFMTGSFQTTASFGSNVVSSSGWGDIFVAKYNGSNGTCTWAVKGGGNGDDNGKAITLGGSDIYITGFFRNTATFGTLPTVSSSGNEDVFVAKLDGNGNWSWVRKGGGTQKDNGLAVVADGAGACYATGFYDGNATFGSANLTGAGVQDMFLVKYDASGNQVYAVTYGGWGNDGGYGIVRDGIGDLLIAGNFEGTANFGPNNTLQVAGISDFFVLKCNPNNGSVIWAAKAGAEDEDFCWGIGVDQSFDAYITGYYRVSCDFASLNSLTANFFNEIYVAKIQNPLGILEMENQIGLNLFPNPANDLLQVSILSTPGFNPGDKYVFTVMDISGKQVLQGNFSGTQARISVENLAPGSYTLLIKSQATGFTGTGKFSRIE
jgi:hypothetical protein